MGWFYLAILSSLFWGTENFLHKVVAKKDLDSSKVSGVMALTATGASLLVVLILGEELTNLKFLVFLAFLDSVTLFASTITKIESLRTITSSIFFPISRIGSLALMVLLSLIFFKESFSLERKWWED